MKSLRLLVLAAGLSVLAMPAASSALSYNYSLESSYPKPHAYGDGHDTIILNIYAESVRCSDNSFALIPSDCSDGGAGGYHWEARPGVSFFMGTSHSGVTFDRSSYVTDSTGNAKVYISSTWFGDPQPTVYLDQAHSQLYMGPISGYVYFDAPPTPSPCPNYTSGCGSTYTPPVYHAPSGSSKSTTKPTASSSPKAATASSGTAAPAAGQQSTQPSASPSPKSILTKLTSHKTASTWFIWTVIALVALTAAAVLGRFKLFRRKGK